MSRGGSQVTPRCIAWANGLMVAPVISVVEHVFHFSRGMCNIISPLLCLKAKVYLLFCGTIEEKPTVLGIMETVGSESNL